MVEIRLGVLDGRVECVGMSIHPGAEGIREPLGTAALRRLRLGSFIDRARNDSVMEFVHLLGPKPDGKPRFGYGLGELKQIGVGPLARDTRRGPGRPALSPALLDEVARIYLDHQSNRTPTMAVSKKMKVSRSTAARYVARARAEGLIGRTSRGRISGPATSGDAGPERPLESDSKARHRR